MARAIRWLFLLPACLSCSGDGTALELTLALDPDVQIDRLQLLEVSVDGAPVLSATRILPDGARGLLRSGDTLRLRFEDADAGGAVQIRGVGLMGGERRTQEALAGTTLQRRKTVGASLRLSGLAPGVAGPPPAATADAGADPPECPPAILPTAPGCVFGYQLLQHARPEVVLALDRSVAMLRTPPGASQALWFELADALEDNLRRTETSLAWGLKLFPTVTSTICDVSIGLDVPVGLSNASIILGWIRNYAPESRPDGTPLGQGIERAATALRGISQNPRYLVLVTDASPACPAGTPGATAAVGALNREAQQGLRSFVVSTAAPGSPTAGTLQDLATVGGERLPDGPGYFVGGDRAQLQAALQTISDRLAACVFTTNLVPPEPDFAAINVGGTRIARDRARRDGWEFGATNQIVHLYGAACARMVRKPSTAVEVVVGCQGHPAPLPPPCQPP
jgi:hypothetical protein